MSNCSGNDAEFVFRHVDVESGAHGVSLSRPGLTVSQNGGVVALEAPFHQMAHGRIVDGALSRVQVVAKVEGKSLVFAQSYLPITNQSINQSDNDCNISRR